MWTQSDDGLDLENGFNPSPSSLIIRESPWDSPCVSSSRSLSPSAQTPSQPKEETQALPNTRNQLRDCLENVHDGRFATSGPLPNAANPGIFVRNLGVVGIPLSHRDAEAIIGIAHKNQNQADHSGSIVSTSIGSCELVPGQFEIQNPFWQETLREAVEETAKALGLKKQTKNMKADAANLRICRPDDMVNDQQQ